MGAVRTAKETDPDYEWRTRFPWGRLDSPPPRCGQTDAKWTATAISGTALGLVD